jgi:hypothetical protein
VTRFEEAGKEGRDFSAGAEHVVEEPVVFLGHSVRQCIRWHMGEVMNSGHVLQCGN